MSTDKEFEDLIRRKMAALEEAPPANAWKKIATDIKPPKKRRPIWWWVGALLLLVTGIGSGIFLIPEESLKPAGTEKIQSEQTKQDTGAADKSVTTQKQDQVSKSASSPRNIADKAISLNLPSAGESKSFVALKTKTTIRFKQRENSLNKPEDQIEYKAESDKNRIANIVSDSVRENTKATPDILVQNVPKVSVADSSINVVQLPQPSSGGVKSNPDPTKTEEAVAVKAPKVKKEKVAAPKEWTAGLLFASRYAFRVVTPNPTDNILITRMSTTDPVSPERLGYELGLNFSRSVAPNLYLETGVSWMQLNENVSYTYTTGEIDTILVRGTPSGGTNIEPVYIMEDRQLISSYGYGGLRLGATYYFGYNGQRRFNFTLAGGANLLIKGRTKLLTNGEWTETLIFPSKENILEQSNYNLLFGAGYNLRILNNYELTLMPALNYFLGSTFKQREPLGLRPYSLGLNIQVKRIFSR